MEASPVTCCVALTSLAGEAPHPKKADYVPEVAHISFSISTLRKQVQPHSQPHYSYYPLYLLSLFRKEINNYLRRVKEETDKLGMKVTPTIALERVSVLVELDYPTIPPDTAKPTLPEKTCPICQVGLTFILSWMVT